MRAIQVNKEPHELEVGEWCWWEGSVYLQCPGGLTANLGSHKILWTDPLTVDPSIEVTGAPGEYWHGWVLNGIFCDAAKVPLP